ncbi:MAG: hypothetical protein ACLS9K_07720 [Lachnospira eligens]
MATSSITKNFVVSGKSGLNNSLMRLKCHIKNLFQNQVHLLADTEKYMKQMKYTE